MPRDEALEQALRAIAFASGRRVVKQSILVLAVAAILGCAGIGSAPAQTLAADVVPPYEVFTIVRSMGLNPVNRPSLRGHVYVLRASNRYGEHVRVVVDARAGRVVSVNPIARGPDVYYEPVRRPPADIPSGRRVIPADPRYLPPRAAPPPRYELDDELDEEDVGSLPPPRSPPRVISAPRFPDVPSASSARSAVVMPAKPPLPRPRPTATLASERLGNDVTGSVAAQPAKPAEPQAETKDSATPPMQGFE